MLDKNAIISALLESTNKTQIPQVSFTPIKLDRKKKYLQVALNSTLEEAAEIITKLPQSDRIIIEAGTPLIKHYGIEAIRFIKQLRPQSYVVADLKTMDRGETEVILAKQGGASGAITLGYAPIETIDSFIGSCDKYEVDSMVDMMNVDAPIKVLRKLKKPPKIVVLHRGVDEEKFNRDKPIPYVQINKVLAAYNVMISIAGGDTIREVQRAVFNGANIVIVWKEFYQPTSHTGQMAEDFLKVIK
jgi:bifunctional enzyme Fae/Hps